MRLVKLKRKVNIDGLKFEWKEFHQNGTVKSTINYKNGFKEGPFEIYFEDGKIKALGNYIKGLEDGNWQEFSNEGNFLYIGNYNQGNLNGRWQTFHLNGRLFSMGNFIEGQKEGLWEYFNEQGELFKIQIFENDVLIKCEGKCPVKKRKAINSINNNTLKFVKCFILKKI